MKIALLQLSAGQDKNANIAKAVVMAEKAIAAGAIFILMPEVFNFRGNTRDKELVASIAEEIPGISVDPFVYLAKNHHVAFLIGSLFEKASNGKAYNTGVFINAQGELTGKYRKINLFDAHLGDKIVREADCFNAGDQEVMVDCAEFKLGLSICYDLRFPTLYNKYARRGANVLAVPSCFTKKTGQAHWEVLLRARAIENLCYVLAPNQVGQDYRGIEAFGNSMIISPWGDVIARGSGDQEEIVYGDIDIKEIEKAKTILPGILNQGEKIYD